MKQYFIMHIPNTKYCEDDVFVVVYPDENLLLKRASEYAWNTFESAKFELSCLRFQDSKEKSA